MTQVQNTQKRWAGFQGVGINKYKVNPGFIDPDQEVLSNGDNLLLEWNPPKIFQRF